MHFSNLLKLFNYLLVTSVVAVGLLSCRGEERLTKVSEKELLVMIENLEYPDFEKVLIKDSSGTVISHDYLKRVFDVDLHAMDYYKDHNDSIVSCKLRGITEKDRAFMKEVMRTKAELTPEELKEIEELHTTKDKSAYLANLLDEDQALRTGKSSELMLKYGRDSPEYRTYVKETQAANGLVFMKMKTYLQKHGCPQNRNEYSGQALTAIPIIIGHNHHYDELKELLLVLYNCYQELRFPLDDLLWVMGELYESKYHHTYDMSTSVFRSEQQFHELNDTLKLNFVLNVKPKG